MLDKRVPLLKRSACFFQPFLNLFFGKSESGGKLGKYKVT